MKNLLKIKNRYIYIYTFFISLFVVGYTFRYIYAISDFDVYRPVWTMFHIHLIFGVTAAIVVCFQYSTKLRQKKPRIHRYLGRYYAISMYICAVSSLFMLRSEELPLWSQSLAVTSALSLITVTMGWFYAYLGNWKEHQLWITRSVIITFAFIISRVFIITGTALELADFDTVAAWSMYLSWGPLLAIHYLRSIKSDRQLFYRKIMGS